MGTFLLCRTCPPLMCFVSFLQKCVLGEYTAGFKATRWPLYNNTTYITHYRHVYKCFIASIWICIYNTRKCCDSVWSLGTFSKIWVLVHFLSFLYIYNTLKYNSCWLSKIRLLYKFDLSDISVEVPSLVTICIFVS